MFTTNRAGARSRAIHLAPLCLGACLCGGDTTLGQALEAPNDPAPRAPNYVEPGGLQVSELYIGGSETSETQTVWRFMCGSNLQGLTADDLQAIAAATRQQMSRPGVRVIDSGLRNGLNLVFNLAGSVPPIAEPAILLAETFIEGKFQDPVTVVIDVAYDNMGSGVIGATGSAYKTATYLTARTSLSSGRDADDILQAMLPYGSSIPVRYTGNSDQITYESRVFFTYANYRAAIGSVSGTAASMTFNTQFSFDYDPSNGVNGTSFMDVIIHEVGHALGFTSGVDFRQTDIEALDLYRFPLFDGTGNYNPDNSRDFYTLPRLQDFNTPNGQHMSDLLSVEYRMEDGSPWQASHFREQGNVIGIMDPAIGPGETLYPDYFLQSDLDMFDAIGWDYPGAQSDCAPPVVVLASDPQQAVCPGDFVQLQVELPPDQTATLQWRRGDTPIVDDGTHFIGATSETLYIIDVGLSDIGDAYNCLATDDCGSSYVSESLSLTLDASAIITDQPDDLSVEPGEPAVFSVSATGVSPTYQWTKDGEDLLDDGRIIGATAAQLLILDAQGDDAGEYVCLVGDFNACTIPSDAATLSVGDADPCPADLNGDGYIGQQDLGILLASYEIDGSGDIDGDGFTGQSDLGLLLAAYDTPCP